MTVPQRHIIIICCHGIWLGQAHVSDEQRETAGGGQGNRRGSSPGVSDDEWLLEPFQKGEGALFRQHVLEGLRVAREQGGELWFSGGPTKRPRTEESEGESYLKLSLSLLENTSSLSPTASSISLVPGTVAPSPSNVTNGYAVTSSTSTYTMHADNFATDSFQNILFPILQSFSAKPSLRADGTSVLTDPSSSTLSSPIFHHAGDVDTASAAKAAAAAAPTSSSSSTFLHEAKKPVTAVVEAVTKEAEVPRPKEDVKKEREKIETEKTKTITIVPLRLTIVSHLFKQARFVAQHLPALGFDAAFVANNVRFVGVDPDGRNNVEATSLPLPPYSSFPPSSSLEPLESKLSGEKEISAADTARTAFEAGERRAVDAWAHDPWGIEEVLGGKRKARGWTRERAEKFLTVLEGNTQMRTEIKDAILHGKRCNLAALLAGR